MVRSADLSERISKRLALGLLALALCCGCGEGRPMRVPASGQVLIDGQPLRLGTVMFVPEGARPSSGRLDEQGRFTLGCFEAADGAVVGKHRVSVSGLEPMGPGAQRWLAPKRYVDWNTSGLTAEITGPTKDLTIELSWNGEQPFVEKTDGF